MNTRHITINILPQDSRAWVFISLAAIGISIGACADNVNGPSSSEIRIAEIEANTQIEIAKIQAQSKLQNANR